MSKRQTWIIPRAGSLSRLHLATEDIGEPQKGRFRVTVHSVGLNFADIFACMGLYSATPKGSFTPGLEFSGTIETVPANTPESELKVGDRVMGLTRFGAYATRIDTTPEYLMKLPDSWSYEEGAAFLVQTLTAWYAIHELGATKPQSAVLVHSAAGGVGLRALELLKTLDCRVVATVGSSRKVQLLQDLHGLSTEQIIVRHRNRFGRQLDTALRFVKETGFDVILDAVAGSFFQPGFERLNPAGRLVVFGSADLTPRNSRPNYLKLALQYLKRPRIDPLNMITQNRSVMGFNLIWFWDRLDLLAHGMDNMKSLLDHPPYVGHAFGFADAPKALRHLQSGQSAGKVVLNVFN